MAESETGLTVVTSLNPFARSAVQLRCFRAWQALGARVLTANTDDEADRLLQLGLRDTDILRLAPGDTGQAIHGKPVPNVAAVLQHLAQTPGTGPVALVNSDLYPAMRDTGGLTYWLEQRPAVALTREECVLHGMHRFADQSPYRGGLDAFVLSRAALPGLLALLQDCAARPRMCFGIPGWDYVLAAAILTPAIGGSLADSGLLLHESHPTTYSSMDEFAHYLGDMQRLAGLTETDPTAAAAAFHAVIQQSCERNLDDSRRVRTIQFTAPRPETAPDAAARALAARLARICPALTWTTRPSAVALLAAQALAGADVDLTRARALFEIGPDPHYRFYQRLLSILFCLDCQAAAGIAPALVPQYPPESLHARMVEAIRTEQAGDPWRQRLEFALLFGAELVSYRIFNPRLYNYLIHCCDTDDERRLMTEIHAHIERLRDAA
ncbi:hypothetical protein ACFMPD_14785 [Sedimentitalea sp. HM32M-2]|uniref:hypothetical protein n=1 Tax=Sedimentitalea sp. HM32M-2 TaxID=3351566 RepID=UPI00363CDEF2